MANARILRAPRIERDAKALAVPIASTPDATHAPWMAMQVETARQAAAAQGYAEGMARAQAEARELQRAHEQDLVAQRKAEERALAEHTASLEVLIAGVNDALAAHTARVAESAVVLAFEAVLRVLGEAQVARPLVARVVEQLMREGEWQGAQIHVSPADHARINAAALQGQGVQWVRDESLSPGQCRIETASGVRDVSVASQLERLAAAWLAALPQQAGNTAAVIRLESGGGA